MKRDQDENEETTIEKLPFQFNKKIKVSRSDNVSYHHDINVIKRFSFSHNNKSPLISSTSTMPVEVNDSIPIGNVNLVSVSGVKKGTGMIATTAKKMMGTTDNKRLNVSDHHNHHDSIQMKQHNQQINANETQEKVIDLVYPKDEQGKVQEKKVLRGQGQSITNNNTDASQAFN